MRKDNTFNSLNNVRGGMAPTRFYRRRSGLNGFGKYKSHRHPESIEDRQAKMQEHSHRTRAIMMSRKQSLSEILSAGFKKAISLIKKPW